MDDGALQDYLKRMRMEEDEGDEHGDGSDNFKITNRRFKNRSVELSESPPTTVGAGTIIEPDDYM